MVGVDRQKERPLKAAYFALWCLPSYEHIPASFLDGAAYRNGIADTGRRLPVDEHGAAPGGDHVLVAGVYHTSM